MKEGMKVLKGLLAADEYIYVLYTGSNRRNRGGEHKRKLISVGRSYVVITGTQNERLLVDPVKKRLIGSFGDSYLYFFSEQEVLDYKMKQRLINNIADNFRYASDYADLSLEDVLDIAGILGVVGNE